MWGLLTWLYERAYRVYYWFDTLWTRAVDTIQHVWSWITTTAIAYYGLAKAFALDWYWRGVALARSLYDAAVALASQWVADARAAALGWVESARALAWQLYNLAVAWATAGIDAAKAVIIDVINQAVLSLQGLVASVQATLTAWAAPVVGLFPSLQGIVTGLSGGNLEKLIALAVSYYGSLTAFLNDPLAVIYAYIRDSFVTFLSYSLAYALGTEEATLPPWPVWGRGGDVPPGPEPPPPPPDAGKIGKPVVPLYISGYTFGPGHWATDFGLTMGQAVFAAHTGTVETIRIQETGLGHHITIRGGDWWTLYAHLLSPDVTVGQPIVQGQRIASGDSTGLSTGPHLHFAVKYKGQYVNPVLVIEN